MATIERAIDPPVPGAKLERQEFLLDGDMSRVLAVLQQGLQSTEHTTFVAQLTRVDISRG